MIGARLFRAFGWITAITPAVRLNPSRVTDRAPSLPQGILLGLMIFVSFLSADSYVPGVSGDLA